MVESKFTIIFSFKSNLHAKLIYAVLLTSAGKAMKLVINYIVKGKASDFVQTSRKLLNVFGVKHDEKNLHFTSARLIFSIFESSSNKSRKMRIDVRGKLNKRQTNNNKFDEDPFDKKETK